MMKSEIVQVGEKVLRDQARPITKEEIGDPAFQQLIEMRRETMRKTRG